MEKGFFMMAYSSKCGSLLMTSLNVTTLPIP